MTNTSNQLPSNEQEAIVQASSNFFAIEINHNQVDFKKENRGKEGSKPFTSNCTDSNEALKNGFGTAKLFVQRNKYDKDIDISNTNFS